LNKNAIAKRSFEALSYSKRKEYVLQTEVVKTTEKMARRINNAIEQLKENSK